MDMENTVNVVREIRNALHLSQEEFGAQIGYSKSAVGAWEIGTNPLNSKIKHAICKKWHVNYDFINLGIGDMFEKNVPIDNTIFDELQSLCNLTNEDITIIKSYISLSRNQRKSINALFKNFNQSS